MEALEHTELVVFQELVGPDDDRRAKLCYPYARARASRRGHRKLLGYGHGRDHASGAGCGRAARTRFDVWRPSNRSGLCSADRKLSRRSVRLA